MMCDTQFVCYLLNFFAHYGSLSSVFVAITFQISSSPFGYFVDDVQQTVHDIGFCFSVRCGKVPINMQFSISLYNQLKQKKTLQQNNNEVNKCSAIAKQLPQQPEIKTKQKFNHNVNMHSLSLLRIDYYGIVYRELFAVSIRARLCVAFMWPTCFAIRYDVCRVFHMKT